MGRLYVRRILRGFCFSAIALKQKRLWMTRLMLPLKPITFVVRKNFRSAANPMALFRGDHLLRAPLAEQGAQRGGL